MPGFRQCTLEPVYDKEEGRSYGLPERACDEVHKSLLTLAASLA